jgi:hypothetical protein
MAGLKQLEGLGAILLKGGKSFRNWHGSPYLFAPVPDNPLGQFERAKVGTGEGGAAFGAGDVYSGDVRAVGQRYKEQLGPQNPYFEHPDIGVVAPSRARQYLADFGARTTPKSDRLKLEEQAHGLVTAMRPDISRKVAGIFAAPEDLASPMGQEASRFKTVDNPGYLYEMEIGAHPELDFLHQDRPMSAQSPKVRQALEELGVDTVDTFGNLKQSTEDLLQIIKREGGGQSMAAAMNKVHGARDYRELRDALYDTEYAAYSAGPKLQQSWMDLRRKITEKAKWPEAGGADAYRALARRMGSEDASMALNEKGVAGMRFLDQGSRPAAARPNNLNFRSSMPTGATSNTITFDARIIKIVARYGIAGAIATGLISEQMGEQLRAAGYSDKATKGGRLTKDDL